MVQHLQPSGLNADFHGTGLHFAEYIEQTRAMIEKARVDLLPSTAQRIIDANTPKEFRASKIKYGVLLIHGLLDSPFVMQDLARSFSDEPALVRTILLPGHGTRPGDLTNVQLEAWRQCVTQAIAWMRQDVDQFVIIGFSTGASLALEHVLKNHLENPLILIAPVFGIQNPLTPFTGLVSSFGNFLSVAQWVHTAPETDYAKYRSMAMNAVYQVYRLSQDLNQLTEESRIDNPLFMLASQQDEVVSVPAMQDFFAKTSREDNAFWIYADDKINLIDTRIRHINSCFPKQRILNYSHVSIVNSPENPHYGRDGDFHDIGHYQTWWGKWLNSIAPQNEKYFGALNQKNLQNYTVQRLTYNPEFAMMKKAVLQFVNNHISSAI